MTPTEWLEEETGNHKVFSEIARLARRGRHRIRLIVVLAVVLSIVVVVRKREQAIVYHGEIRVRITEGEILRMQQPLLPARLVDYFDKTALSREVLAAVIEDLGLFPDMRGRDLQDAVEDLRSAITLEVFDNYFADSRGYSKSAKTAAVVFGFDDTDRDIVMPVLYAIVEKTRNLDAVWRVHASHDEALTADVALLRVEQRFLDAEENSARAALLMERAAGAGLAGAEASAYVLYMRLQRQSLYAGALLERFRIMKERVSTRRSVDSNALAIDYQVADEVRPSLVRSRGWFGLGMLVLMAIMPIVGVFVAAFDPRLYLPVDYSRLGLECLAVVPSKMERQSGFRERLLGRTTTE